MISTLFITLSTIDLLIRTLPEYHKNETFDIIEIVCIAWFTIEVIVRFVVAPKKLNFFKSLMNIFDIISIIPFFVYLGLKNSKEASAVKNVSRILRTISVLKIFRIFRSIRTLGKTLIHSLKEMFLFFGYLLISVIVFSSIVYYFEYEHEKSLFTSIPDTMW